MNRWMCSNLQMDVFHLYFPHICCEWFRPSATISCQKMLDLHDLSVSPALLAIRWWLAEVGRISGVAEVNRLRFQKSGCQGCWKDELTRYMKICLGLKYGETYICIYIYIKCTVCSLVHDFSSLLVPLVCVHRNFVPPSVFFPFFFGFAKLQVLSTLDMKNLKRDPGIIVGFLAGGSWRKLAGGI